MRTRRATGYGSQKVRLSDVADLSARVYRAYLLKEELRAMYRCGPQAADTHLDGWLSWASRSKLAPFVKLGRTLRGYRKGVLAAIRLGFSNGDGSLNSKIGVLKHRAYGFHSFGALAAMVFLCCTDLKLVLPSDRDSGSGEIHRTRCGPRLAFGRPV